MGVGYITVAARNSSIILASIASERDAKFPPMPSPFAPRGGLRLPGIYRRMDRSRGEEKHSGKIRSKWIFERWYRRVRGMG